MNFKPLSVAFWPVKSLRTKGTYVKIFEDLFVFDHSGGWGGGAQTTSEALNLFLQNDKVGLSRNRLWRQTKKVLVKSMCSLCKTHQMWAPKNYVISSHAFIVRNFHTNLEVEQ